MLAAVLNGFQERVVIDELDVDEVGPDEVLVRTVASGVCHSDRSIQQGLRDTPLPLILGHESAGVVEKVGELVTSLQPGDHVVGCAKAHCGRCAWCQSGRQQLCVSAGHLRAASAPPRLTRRGSEVRPMTGLGGFATHMLVSERSLVAVPREIPLDRAALLGCAVLTGFGAVRHRAQVALGDTVVVIGCGGVGLNVVQAAKLAGASAIIAVDLIESKLNHARLFGATHVVHAGEEDVDAVVRAIVGGADHVFEVVGRPATIAQACRMASPGGTATIVGAAAQNATVEIPTETLLREIRLQGSLMGSSRFQLDIPLYARMYLEGRLMLDEMISARVRLEDVNDSLIALDGSESLRQVIHFGD
ncbi:Zn-dependent alcohol dehydrogenase [Arthrobacter sp. GCM10027362]|uniref:Zn-dependent alcohol dehydrogenase n=1 Tax=Arthrobacter sp. GCM10027362 TaxID=3273379 RepID=UPI003632AC24